MKKKDLYEKLYFHEIEQRDKLASRLQLPLAIIITLVGFLGFLLKDTRPTFESAVEFVFWFGWIGALIALLAASYFFVRALWGNTYIFLPAAVECEKYYLELVDSRSKKNNAEKQAKKDFQVYLDEKFRNYSSKNAKLNDHRSLQIFKSITLLITTAFFSIVSFGGHYVGNLVQKDNDQPISIQETKMTDKNTAVPTKNKTPIKQPTQPSPRRVIEEKEPKQTDPSLINEKSER